MIGQGHGALTTGHGPTPHLGEGLAHELQRIQVSDDTLLQEA